MKKRDKYPSASEEDINSLAPGLKILGLHPLIWVLAVVLAIAAARACDTVEDLGCEFIHIYAPKEPVDKEQGSSEHSSKSKGVHKTHKKGTDH